MYRVCIRPSSCCGYELTRSISRSDPSPFSPAVMLSPNAMKFCTDSAGRGGTSSTLNEHAAVRMPSVASHLTDVIPSEKAVLDAGEQVVVIGGLPPVAVGAGYDTIAVGVATLPTR